MFVETEPILPRENGNARSHAFTAVVVRSKLPGWVADPRENRLPPSPTAMELKSFRIPDSDRIGLNWAPNIRVCPPFVQVASSRNVGVSTVRSCSLIPAQGA